MKFDTGYFDRPEIHHNGWFKVFRFGTKHIEIWFGNRYVVISR